MSVLCPRRRRWDQAIIHLVEPEPVQSEPVTLEPVTPVVTPEAPPAPASALQAAEAAVREAETCAQNEQAIAHLDALRRGGQQASEPAPPVPAPPVSSPGTAWVATKVVVRDAAGLVTKVEERWEPQAAEPI